MKTLKIKSTLIAASLGLLLAGCSNQPQANQKTASFKVYGNCGMCEKTIEGSLETEGIFKGDWDKNSKNITVEFDSTLTNLNKIKERIAAVGYDTDSHRATEETYNALHSCCQYDRPD